MVISTKNLYLVLTKTRMKGQSQLRDTLKEGNLHWSRDLRIITKISVNQFHPLWNHKA